MIANALLFPCLSVFALSTAAPITPDEPQPAPEMEQDAPAEAAAAQDDGRSDDQTSGDQTSGDQTAGDQTTGPVDARPVEVDPETGIVIDSEQAADDGPAQLPQPVFAELTDAQVFDRAIDYIQGIGTLQSRFIQIAPSGNVSAGLMQLSRPGRLRFEYDEPNPTLIVASQGLVYVHDSELETTDSYPVNKTPLKFLLNRRIDREDATLTSVQRFADSVALTLESADHETQGQLVLEFTAPDLQLARWSVYDPRGGVTVVELEAPETGMRIANNAFRVPEAGGSFLRDR